ncbi:ABC-2 type transport system permease protein [Pseudomonas citronellolis]|uniref:ABC-2 type transport system permease protein n=1 Tax=Pseudomonas citronellolis TaxID=53408 RepID=A0AAQ1HK05_9PSED|nr:MULTISPECIES: ABC transporter permease [Pseudomonas]MCL6689830.1 ABC transporter permease [Pseudomonas sp. R3.Fl]MCP1606402.1 ABC-2 type transport system permease protein [Pseudomonas citronellolis]MCP1641584.1 ABC-2 type transport system permease protein [Pseudomonas citronellolis]MCP1657032.1 ABC-2 type transport system permease protein [Pseudomonas citronellolis]MCP1664502.1 ABC-2 type transport system permease protein [Pseudomonas citronellolis]
MKKLANIFNLGVKEFRSLGRDYAMLILIAWAFTLGVYSSATGVPETLHHAPIAVVDEDQSQLSSRIINAFQAPYFRTPEMIGHAQMDRGMDTGLYTFTLDIPPDFQRDVLAGRQPAVQVNVDATQTAQAFSGAGYIQNIIATEVREFVSRYRSEPGMPAELAVRMEFNPNLTQAWFGAVMEVINQITMLSIILTGAALIREREHGTVEHLLVMPLTAFEIMLAKVWSMGVVVLAAAALSLQLVVRGWLDVPISGSLALFLLGAALHLFATTSMGIFLGTVARSMPQLGLLVILTLMPLQILSGGTTPRESMPELVQNIMLFAPTTHFVSLAQAILFRGAGLAIVWPQLLAIIGIGAAFFCGALWRFRRTISQMA